MTYLLEARSTNRDVWVLLEYDGRPSPVPWLLPDGSDVYQLIPNGETERLGFVPRFVQSNRGTRLGDLVWTTGAAKIASRRFVDVLESIGATGFRTFPVEALDRDGQSLGDFVGFAVLDDDTTKDLHFSTGFQFWHFAAADRVVKALRESEVTDLSIKPA